MCVKNGHYISGGRDGDVTIVKIDDEEFFQYHINELCNNSRIPRIKINSGAWKIITENVK